MSNEAAEASGFTRLVQLIRFEIPAAPQPVVIGNLIRAMHELGTNGLFKFTVTKCTYKNVSEYDFTGDLLEGWKVHAVDRVKFCGQCLDPIDPCHPCPHGFAHQSQGCIVLHPCPPADQEIEVTFSIKPSPTVCEIPEQIMCEYEYLLQERAKMHLFNMSGTSWHDRREGQRLLRTTNAEMMSASAHVSMQYHNNHDSGRMQVI